VLNSINVPTANVPAQATHVSQNAQLSATAKITIAAEPLDINANVKIFSVVFRR